MRKFLSAVALVAACSAWAVATPQAQTKSAAKSTAKVATHSTSGTVKSIDANTLVISKGKSGSDMTFSLNSSTQKDSSVAVGSMVTVRYQTEGKTMMATAITPQAHHEASTKASTKTTTKK